MLVLIVTKTTNYELHGAVIEAKVGEGRVSPDALTRLKTAHTEHYATLNRLREVLVERGVGFDEVSREEPKPYIKPYDAVVTVGGDGTLLSASQKMTSGGLIAGIRSSLSSVGYLCCVGPDGVDALVDKLTGKKLRDAALAAHRIVGMVTRADSGKVIETPPVLNDFLYANASPAATTRYKLTFGADAEVHRSSGIWVATGIGSTAAISAAGGQRRSPDDSHYQFRVRELYRFGPIEPKISGGVFDPDRDVFEIENRCPQAILAFDGQHGATELSYGDRIKFRRAPPVTLARPWTQPRWL